MDLPTTTLSDASFRLQLDGEMASQSPVHAEASLAFDGYFSDLWERARDNIPGQRSQKQDDRQLIVYAQCPRERLDRICNPQRSTYFFGGE